MKSFGVPTISISEIKIVNPRPRNKITFAQIVSSISTLGLKTPITVSMREMSPDGTQYDLVCGQGRLEAFLALGQTRIPAIIISASREDQYLMSLVENFARRPPSELGLLRAIKSLRERGYSVDEIASKLGLGSQYIGTIVMLLRNGETTLIGMVESGRIPLTVATEIAKGTSVDVQRALTEAYESGDLRGPRLKAARMIIRKRLAAKRPSGTESESKTPVTSRAVVKQYQEHTREQRALVQRAHVVQSRLALSAAACRRLFADENFLTLLRAEGLTLLSEKLLEQTREY